MDKRFITNTTLLIIIVYTLAHGLIFFNNGIFWDDWTIYHNESGQILEIFRQAGASWVGYIHNKLLSFDNSILLYRSIVFFSYLFSALLLNGILKTVGEIDDVSRIFIVIFFAIFPVNSSRITMITAPSTFTNFLFFLGFWMTSRMLKSNSFFLRISTLIVFFLSFTLNSLLFYFSIVLVYIFYRERAKIISFRIFLNHLIRYSDFLLLPIAFWALKILFFTPYGSYAEYNHLTIRGILFALKWILVGFYVSFVEVVFCFFGSISIVMAIFSLIFMKLIKQNTSTEELRKHYKVLLMMGILLLFVGIFPYMAVYDMPRSDIFNGRHQMLVPLGAAFILYYSLKILFDNLGLTSTLKTFLFSIITFLFINVTVKTYLDFQKDWYKQLSLVENFKSSKVMRNNTTFLFVDNTTDLNANYRVYGYPEYTHLMRYTFGDGSRLGENFNWYYGSGPYNDNFDYSPDSQGLKSRMPEFNVMIDHGDYKVDTMRLIRLMVRERMTHDFFLRNIQTMIKLTFTPIQ